MLAHRGASGYRPEHTASAYELAVALGADYIEPDLVMTKDSVLVDRHEPEISETADVAAHPDFADRRTTKRVDGRPVTGWFVEDSPWPNSRRCAPRNGCRSCARRAFYDGRWTVLTFEEVLRQRDQLSRPYHCTIGIIPEIKHSTYLHEKGFDPRRPSSRRCASTG
ncbi:MAG: glycerophosphodiester phosphodiesterase family protein [Tetrasphaera sp.]